MRRRELMGSLGAWLAWPLAAGAQTAQLRVGYVGANPRSNVATLAFERGMAELGHRDGQNFVFDFVKVPGADAFDAGFRELMARRPDVILSSGSELNLRSAIAASSNTTPIVMLAVDFDPIARGYVASLANPGGRITGLYLPQIELTVKRLQFFKDAFPAMRSATVFWDRISAGQWEAARDAGARFGLELAGVDLGAPPYDYELALDLTPPSHHGSLFGLTSPFFLQDRARQADFALRHGMASIFASHEWVEAGGLMSYGQSITEMFRRAAYFIDRIAHGAHLAELPIEQPSKYELAVNLATARALGLELPPLLLARADRVIE